MLRTALSQPPEGGSLWESWQEWGWEGTPSSETLPKDLVDLWFASFLHSWTGSCPPPALPLFLRSTSGSAGAHFWPSSLRGFRILSWW